MKIAMTSYLNTSGLSTVAQEYFKCLTANDFSVVPVWLMPVTSETIKYVNKEVADAMIEASEEMTGDTPLQFHTGLADSAMSLKNRSKFIGSIVVEGNTLTKRQAVVCRSLDAVMSPSRFCYDSCLASGIPRSKLTYAPYPLDTRLWNTNDRPIKKDGDRFKFLFLNTFYERKGWDVLLKAWWEEFSAEENVELVVKSYMENDRMIPVDVMIAITASALGVDRSKKAPIRVIDQVMHSDDLPAFVKSFDAYVSPHRSEGFGLNILQAMACGTPVICTNYGGCTDFALEDTAWLTDIAPDLVPPSEKELAIFGNLKGTVWAEPDIFSLRRAMRECMENRAEREFRSLMAAKFAAEKYSYQMAYEGFKECVEKLSYSIWSMLRFENEVKVLLQQSAPRYENRPLRLVEV